MGYNKNTIKGGQTTMRERDLELINACNNATLYDYIACNGYLYSKDELIEIIKQLEYSIYERLSDQTVEVTRLLPDNLKEYGFFDESEEIGEALADESWKIGDEDTVESYAEFIANMYNFDKNDVIEVIKRPNPKNIKNDTKMITLLYPDEAR